MKLAEALSLRKDLETRISKIKKLLETTVKVQEGDEPAEDPLGLMTELEQCLEKLEGIIYAINMTNIQIVADDGRTMTRLLAERDVLSKRLDVLRSTYETLSGPTNRFGRNEIKYVSTIDAKPLRKQIDQLSQEYRQLDMKIQAMNFNNDLVEL